MARTTPPRPVDLTALFPGLAPLQRTATRLHPRPGTPGVRDSSVGGPLLWPADEPWPVCDQEHGNGGDFVRLDAVRRRRAVLSAAGNRGLTPEERAELAELDARNADPATPTTMLAVAQLFTRDVPDLVAPPEADVLQVLWCPRDHDPHYCPAPMLRWRRSADVTDVLAEQPEPEVMEYEYLPEPCVLHPEQVVEYPYSDFLPEELRTRVRAWEQDSGHHYSSLAIANGWKVGGYASWHLTDPLPMDCECGAPMELLFKVDSGEWDGELTWRPVEDADGPVQPTQVIIGRGYGFWIFTCPRSLDHPLGTSMQ